MNYCINSINRDSLLYRVFLLLLRIFFAFFSHFYSLLAVHLFYFYLHVMDRALAAALPKQKRLSIEGKLSICKRYIKKVSVKILAADFQVNRDPTSSDYIAANVESQRQAVTTN